MKNKLWLIFLLLAFSVSSFAEKCEHGKVIVKNESNCEECIKDLVTFINNNVSLEQPYINGKQDKNHENSETRGLTRIIIFVIFIISLAVYYFKDLFITLIKSSRGEAVFVSENKDGKYYGKCPTCGKKVEYKLKEKNSQVMNCNYCGEKVTHSTQTNNDIET